MLIELLCPKCRAPLEVDNEIKMGTCPYCGTKSLISDTIPKKVEVELPDLDKRRSEQLTEYSLRMFIQGEKGASIKAIDDALKLDADNTKAWVLYSALTGKPLASNIRSKLDDVIGKEYAREIKTSAPELSKSVYAIYPELSPDVKKADLRWDDIQSGEFLTIKFRHECNSRKNDVVHYYNWTQDEMTLERGDNSLQLESGIHVFVNRIAKRYLAIAVPEIYVGSPLYMTSLGKGFFTEPGLFQFRTWKSDSDNLLVNSFIIDEKTKEKISVDCQDMRERVESLLD